MSTTSYYLYQKYISVDGGEPTPAYPAEYSYDGEGTMPPVVKEQYDTECGQVDIYRWVDTDDFICEETYSSQYLTIESLENGNTIYWKYDNSGYSARTISVSTDDGETWTAYTATSGGSGTTIATLNNGDKLLIKGQNNTYAKNNFNSTKQFKVYGNIMSLVSGDTFENADTLTNIATFTRLFNGATGLVDAENLVLPATTLTSDCYEAMFYNCTSLTTAPALPATTLIYDCYYAMFWNCTSLTTAPELPATTLANGCYWNMFYGCTSLTVAPELPATTLANDCYLYMFNGCTSLTTAPALPATTLARGCYEGMFLNCTGLTTAPSVLPATTLASYCYSNMFQGCTSLTTAPELPATALTDWCYNSMFYGCRSLTSAPSVLPATTLAEWCYSQMFNGCTNLTTAPELPATSLAVACYHTMFWNCTSLNYIKCLATDISANSCTVNWVVGVASSGTFVKASSMNNWTTGSAGIPTNWTVQNA